ncbi:MAG: hypothetical protein WBA93_00265 [Microcoleaceae cyanobacterium]
MAKFPPLTNSVEQFFSTLALGNISRKIIGRISQFLPSSFWG